MTINRITRWIILVGLLQMVVAETVIAAAPEKRRSRKPNIVILLADDLGWRDLHCYGSSVYETPNIDRLASEGMTFNSAYAACSVCSPTRAALLTGKYPARLRLTHIIQKQSPIDRKLKVPDWTPYLRLNEVTIAEMLRPAGYLSAHVGKWHVGGYKERSEKGDQTEGDPLCQGFAVNIAGSHRGQPPDYYFPYRRTYPSGVTYDLPYLPDGRPGEYLTDWLTRAAEIFIEANQQRSFFLHMSFYSPHTSMGDRLQARKATIAKYQSKLKAHPDTPQKNPVYAAMIEHLDHNVGRLLRKLDELKIAQETVVIFTSDNGGYGTKTSNLPLRGAKSTPYEGGVRVPLIVRWPGTVRPGSVSDDVSISVDLFPTIRDIAGIEPDPNLVVDGESLTPVLAGSGGCKRDAVYWHFPHYGRLSNPHGAIRQGDFKLIELFEDGRLELFDLARDLSERNNLASQMPDKVRQLQKSLQSWRLRVGAQMPTPNHTRDP